MHNFDSLPSSSVMVDAEHSMVEGKNTQVADSQDSSMEIVVETIGLNQDDFNGVTMLLD